MAKKIITWIIVPFMIIVFVLDIATVVLCNKNCARFAIEKEDFSEKNGNDKIHFLNTSNSDAVLIESNGRFALVDAGEGGENPRRKNEYPDFSKTVISYLKKTAGDEHGKVHLDFVLCTHYHYDHSGGFHSLFSDEDITVGTAYMKEYDPSVGKPYEPYKWGLQGIYDEIIRDINLRGFDLVQSLPDKPFALGDFTVLFFNTVTPENAAGRGENAACVGVKLTKGEKSAFLAADITASTGLEQELKDSIGKVELLKIGHHGYYGSSSRPFVKVLRPEISIVTNRLGKIYPNVKWNLTMTVRSAIFATFDNDGIIASFKDGGEIVLTNHIH
ncbi:MAG: MBL fold metallo-hydrolase [Clostridiales bacterium]|jgi:beta-lactamase superfamily II metal-dependent hydrolase|nr:MBL fold metallo-hydrolase [Clostridiales bacterium]